MSDDRPTVHFDHHSREFAENPWPVLQELREHTPVAWSEEHGGFWVLTRYEDIKRVALDDETFSSADGILIPAKKNKGQQSIPIETDPPVFHEYRRIMQPLFAPKAIERLDPAIGAFVHRCIDGFIERGECDLVHDLADPVPAMTTLHKLGLPVEDWPMYSEPQHKTVFLRQDHPERPAALEGLKRMREAIVDAVQDRKEHPRDDMITYLTRATVGDRPIEDREVTEMVQLTIQGGMDTTGSAISSAVVQLADDRETRLELANDPDALAVAVEEFLRFEPPQFALARTAKEDVEIGGQEIRAGERMLLVWASGNRDGGVFDDPDELVLDRFPNRHMTFGLGAHRCLGSTMARRMMATTLRALFQRIPDYAVDPDAVERAETIGVVYGKFSVPATFTPGEPYGV